MSRHRARPIRVLYMDHVPRMSGAEQSLADLVIGVSRGPVEPVVVLPADGPLAHELRANGVLVRMVPMNQALLETSRTTLHRSPFAAIARLGAFLAASWRVWGVIREVQPDVVHTNTLKSHLIAAVPCTVARVPLIWHMRDILPAGWLRRALLTFAQFASVIIVPSRAVAEGFRGRARVYRKLRLIPNGIHIEEFVQARKDRSLREMIGARPGDVVIGIVARMAPWKGQDVFLRAAAMVARRHPKAHFAVVGAPLFAQDHAYEQALHQMVAEMGIAERVSFLGWQPSPEAMAALDIVVHASQEPEPFGRSLVEAMAAGKPLVAAAGGAVAEIVPPAAGFVIPPSRPELLADALDRLLEDKRLRLRMGDAGAQIAESFFPVSRTIQSVAQLYRGLAARAARKRRKASARRPKKARREQPVAPEPPLTWPSPVNGSSHAPVKNGSSNGNGNGRSNGNGNGRSNGNGNGRSNGSGNGHGVAREPLATEPYRVAIPPSIADAPDEHLFDESASVDASPNGNGHGSPNGTSPTGVRVVARMEPVTELRAVPRRARSLVAPLRVQARPSGAVAVAATAAVLAPPSPVLAPPAPVLAPPVPLAPAPAPASVPGVAPKPLYDALKRAMDVVLSTTVLIVGMPIWILIAIAIKLESPGPVLFRGTVVGKNCMPFTYFKFRSMRIDGDDKAHRRFIERYVRENGGHEVEGEIIYKMLGDDRVTSVGRFIRKLSLDEIPQLMNVLRGEMSIVGPRPPLDYEFTHYDARAKRRLAVPPGITGMQQVWHRHSASFEEKLGLDFKYIRDRSLWLDVKLILHSVRAVFRGH